MNPTEPAPLSYLIDIRPKAPLAVVTMVYNEADFLPIWRRYYGAQVGLENCFVVDHGSDDGSTDHIAPVNRLRIPRSPLEDVARAHFISGLCSSLLTWYNAVIYCDVDEILVADPARWPCLADFAAATPHATVTACGINVLHWLRHEPDLDPAAPLLMQRGRVFFASSMCKPLFTRRSIKWVMGFHAADCDAVFDGLFNFHIAYIDLKLALRRQARRRAGSFFSDNVARHHRESDAAVHSWMASWSDMAPEDAVRLDEACAPSQAMLRRVKASEGQNRGSPFRIDIDIWGDRLWRIPDRFRGVF